jgi:hypothetical protein
MGLDKSIYEELVESGTVAAGTYAQSYKIRLRKDTTGLYGTWPMLGLIDFSDITINTDAGDAKASLILGGKATTGGHTTPSAPIVFGTANQHAMQFYFKSTVGKFTGVEINAYTSDITTDTDSPCCAVEAVGRSLAVLTGTNSIYGIRAEAQVLAGKAGPRSGYELIAGLFKTATAATATTVAGKTVGVKIELGHSLNTTGGDFGMYIRNNSIIQISRYCQAIHFDGGFENVFSFGEQQSINYGDAWIWGSGSSGGAGHIRCRMWNGSSYATKYIRLFDS